MKFIHVADVHLGMVPDKGKPWSQVRSKEIEQTFWDLLKYAEKEQVDLLLIAGDLFHGQPTLNQLEDLDYHLAQLTSTKTVLIAGNHDCIEDGSAWEGYKFSSKTVVLPKNRVSRVYIKSLDTYVAGRSYYRQEISLALYNTCKPSTPTGRHILLAHGGDAKHSPMNFEKMRNSGFDYIALGHIHKPQAIVPDKMAYCGSLEPLDYTETGDHGFIMGEIDDQGCHTTFVPYTRRRYINLSVEARPNQTNGEINDILEKEIIKRGKDNIYRILVHGRLKQGVALDFMMLKEKYLIYEIIDETDGDYQIDQLYEENRENLLGQFIAQFIDKPDAVSQMALKHGVEAILATGKKSQQS